jgi:RNA recognition motif-containing protein
MRAQGIDPGGDEIADLAEVEPLPEVKLEDVVIGVVSQPRRTSFGPTKLFVGGLSPQTTTDQLRAAFLPYGAIVDVAVIPDRATGRSRGFGFVSYANREDAAEAIKRMNGAELDGHTLKVNRAEER